MWLLLIAGSSASSPSPAEARGGLHWAQLDELHAAFDFLVGIDIERYQVHGIGVPPREAEKVFLGQRLGGYGEGSFVHPKLWYWRALVDVLFIEDIVGGDLAGISATNYPIAPVQSGERFAVEPEYDVQFTFLQDHPYPVVAYSSRRTHLVRREFMSNYWLNTLTAGASAGWHNQDFPFSVQYSYLLNEGDERELTAGAEQHQVYATGQSQSEATRTSVEYRFTDYHNRHFPETDYAFHYGYALASFDLDEDDDYRIDTSARAQHRDFQLFTQDEVRGTVLLIGRLVPSLRLRLQSDVAWWNLDAQDGVQTAAWADLRHQLFDSLTTTVLGRFVYDKGEETERKEGTASGTVTYRKDLGPLVMTHGYLAAGTWTAFGATGGAVDVLDEPVSLEGEILAQLAWPEVTEASIVVLDSTRTIRYQRDLDFRVERRGSITYLRRNTGGDIPDGATVLVSYEYQVSGSTRSQQLDQQYYARLETDLWDFFKLYGQYIYREDQRWLDRGEDVFLTWHEAVSGLDAGGEGARVAAEYRYVTSAHYTAHQVSVGTSYVLPILPNFNPLLGVRELYLDIDITGERKNLLEIYSESTYPIWGPITGEWHVSYQWEDGGPNDGQYLFGNTKVTWTIRKILLWLEYEVALERKERQSYDRHAITFNVRRMF